MNREKHLFIQNQYYGYSSLGDTCMEAFSYYTIVKKYNLDAKFIIKTNQIFDEIWYDLLGKENVLRYLQDVPEEYKLGKLHRPTDKDVGSGQWASYDLIEGLMWENGFFDTKNIKYEVPSLYNCGFNTKNVLIYPDEKTDGNKVFDSDFWISTYKDLKKHNYNVYYLGTKNNIHLKPFYDSCQFDIEFQPNIKNLKECINNCTLAVGASTGPTWFCLFSNIRQIVFQSKSSAGYWNLERYQFSLQKKIKLIPTFDATLRDLIHSNKII